ncbi:RNA polymerase sigma factor, sigma-70 family [Trichlorobacter thiogenes]|uniref:RNA polymerase sigma factor, sigma-70 family n=1 Tax=Trichlorobacter thiogenes TaxID=115783 RepID=A0A1T4S574_9BACT|nr:RNA polymerase sigma factor [Trichlorobacter thiogenes]SKA23373.1 RNA polymerase sigma factor, sigma-70 family [Trichlorobacter thiogenes]
MRHELTSEQRDKSLDSEVALAKEGDRTALETVIRTVQQDAYGVAVRFLWHPQDAEDATQEILIRVITGLGGFRGDSSFRTWVYRIACNTLLSLGKKRMEQQSISFEAFGEDLGRGLSDSSLRIEYDIDRELLLEEVKIGCTLAMLMCLDRNHRLAYVLGEIIELDHSEAAEVLDISRAAYRKRLSRAQSTILSFMTSRCGLVNPDNACRCHRRLATAIELGRVVPKKLLFAPSLAQANQFPGVLAKIRQLEESRRVAALYRSHPKLKPSGTFITRLKSLLEENPNENVRHGASKPSAVGENP